MWAASYHGLESWEQEKDKEENPSLAQAFLYLFLFPGPCRDQTTPADTPSLHDELHSLELWMRT